MTFFNSFLYQPPCHALHKIYERKRIRQSLGRGINEYEYLTSSSYAQGINVFLEIKPGSFGDALSWKKFSHTRDVTNLEIP